MGGLDRLRADLAAVAEDAEVVAADRARVAGAEIPVSGAGGPVSTLAEALYGRHYVRPQTGAEEPDPGATADSAAFLEALRAANPVPPRQELCTIIALDAWGLSLVDARGVRRRAAYAEAVPGPGGFAAGQPVTLAAPRETLTGPSGHYAVFGRSVSDPRQGRQVRFYWNMRAGAAAAFLATAAGGFERRRIPFQAKVPAHPAGYRRADAGVLYLDAEDVEAARDVLAATYSALRDGLRRDTPMFARPLAPGLAFAESPQSGESFGMQRCRLVAEGLAEAFAAGASDARARAEAVLARLTRYGFEPEAPERNAATQYPYRFEGVAAP